MTKNRQSIKYMTTRTQDNGKVYVLRMSEFRWPTAPMAQPVSLFDDVNGT
jgi:hypothetical protein